MSGTTIERLNDVKRQILLILAGGPHTEYKLVTVPALRPFSSREIAIALEDLKFERVIDLDQHTGIYSTTHSTVKATSHEA